MRVDVDFSGGMADGQTICDTRDIQMMKETVMLVEVNNDLFHQQVFSLLEKCKII